uniref:p24 n=1 Tax=Grapevine leafroll-associated virus 1 TaxID=47985 RepID=A0A4D6EBE4_9CLOS|nr:p24 [Grapevine leafroll-associated virus 1]
MALLIPRYVGSFSELCAHIVEISNADSVHLLYEALKLNSRWLELSYSTFVEETQKELEQTPFGWQLRFARENTVAEIDTKFMRKMHGMYLREANVLKDIRTAMHLILVDTKLTDASVYGLSRNRKRKGFSRTLLKRVMRAIQELQTSLDKIGTNSGAEVKLTAITMSLLAEDCHSSPKDVIMRINRLSSYYLLKDDFTFHFFGAVASNLV